MPLQISVKIYPCFRSTLGTIIALTSWLTDTSQCTPIRQRMNYWCRVRLVVCNSFTGLERSDPRGRYSWGTARSWGLLYSVPTALLCIFTRFLLAFFVHFLVIVHFFGSHVQLLGQHSCMRSTFSNDTLNVTFSLRSEVTVKISVTWDLLN